MFREVLNLTAGGMETQMCLSSFICILHSLDLRLQTWRKLFPKQCEKRPEPISGHQKGKTDQNRLLRRDCAKLESSHLFSVRFSLSAH